MRFVGETQTAAEAASNPDPAKRDHYAFGAGRRICPGIHVAEQSLFQAIARLLWAFRFERSKDEAGNEIVPDRRAMTDGVLIRPRPFPCKILPRSERHARAVRKEWKRCEEDMLDGEMQWRQIPEAMRFAV